MIRFLEDNKKEILVAILVFIALNAVFGPNSTKQFIVGALDNFKQKIDVPLIETGEYSKLTTEELENLIKSNPYKPDFDAEIDIIPEVQTIQKGQPFYFQIRIKNTSLNRAKLKEPYYNIIVFNDKKEAQYTFPEGIQSPGQYAYEFTISKRPNVDEEKVKLTAKDGQEWTIPRELYEQGAQGNYKLRYFFTPEKGGNFQIYVILLDDEARPEIPRCSSCDEYIKDNIISYETSNEVNVLPTSQPTVNLAPLIFSALATVGLLFGAIKKKEQIKSYLQHKERWYAAILILVALISLILVIFNLLI